MADLDLEELKRLRDNAAPLPWGNAATTPEERLMVAAVNSLPALIAEVERLRAELKEAKSKIGSGQIWRSPHD